MDCPDAFRLNGKRNLLELAPTLEEMLLGYKERLSVEGAASPFFPFGLDGSRLLGFTYSDEGDVNGDLDGDSGPSVCPASVSI